MIDDLDRNLLRLGFVEWIARRGVERRPCGLVDLGTQRAFEFFMSGSRFFEPYDK